MFIFLYLLLVIYSTYCGVHYDRRNLPYNATTLGDVIIYFLMGFIPFVNLYLCLVESFYIVKDAKIFSHVLIESPQTLAAKKLKVEQKKQELSEWEEF